jgi:hypothetical protein
MAVFEDLLGKVIISITGADAGSDCMEMECSDGSIYKLYHYQDCCESVSIEDITGNIQDLLGTPVLMADAAIGDHESENTYDSCTWTFYKLATVKGYVDIRWLGTSNGYYSESVDFQQVREAQATPYQQFAQSLVRE